MAARRTGMENAPSGAAMPGGDRRRASRIDSVIRATVRQAELNDAPVTTARAVDISDSGVRLLLRRQVPVGQRVVLDLECELPLRVHMGYDAHSLVIDGPMHTHLVRIAGNVARAVRLPNRLWEVGIEFCEDTTRF
ncbi:MAG: hypothetical protein JWM86_465, partial [Thermoleophilia bacterium]|nr:hypothetical protein [Thermoleophilia bacterium]